MEESWGLQDYSTGEPDFSTDPVCGQTLEEGKAHYKTGYAGVMFYFCSLDCQKKFEEEPGRYIGQEEKRRHA